MFNNSWLEFFWITRNQGKLVFPRHSQTIPSKRGIGRSWLRARIYHTFFNCYRSQIRGIGRTLLKAGLQLPRLRYFLLANRRPNTNIARCENSGQQGHYGICGTQCVPIHDPSQPLPPYLPCLCEGAYSATAAISWIKRDRHDQNTVSRWQKKI